MSWNKGLLVAALALANAHAHATDHACPARHDGQPLSTGFVLDGPLERKAILEADVDGVRRGVEFARWQVDYVYDAGRLVTLDCRYGADQVSAPVVVEARVKTCSYSKSKKRGVTLGCK